MNRLIPLLSVGGMLLTGLLYAEDAPVKPHIAEETAPRMVSLVLLLSEPRTIDATSTAKAVSKAWKSEVPESAVSTMDSILVVKGSAGRFAINSAAKPYFAESDKLAEELKDPALVEAVQKHRAWLSVDWLEKNDQADLQVVYQQLGKVIAQFVNKETLAIYSPDTDQFHLNDSELIAHLQSDDPLEGLSDADETASPRTVSIPDDDPRLMAARAEAKKNWPEFLKAFKARSKDQYFSVKGPLVEGENSEFLWLKVIDIDDKLVHGVLDNDPVALTKTKHGADVHIEVSDVDDWLYGTDTGKDDVKGGYTLRLFDDLAKASPKK
ncbi:MAG: DUF2314 domain-containing protein [Verrucomicrobiota bacterium]